SPGGCLTFHYSTQYGGDSWSAAVTCPPVPTCFAPTGITMTPSAQGGSVAYTGASAAHQYRVVSNGAAVTAPALTTGISSANPLVITSGALVGGTPYTLYLRGICAPGDTSDWTAAINFTTAAGCGGPYQNATYVALNQYPTNQDVTTTICPNSVGDVVTVTFTDFKLGLSGSNADELYVFDGPTTGATMLASSNPTSTAGFPAGGYSSNVIPGPFTSTHASGCLTFRFRSDANNAFAVGAEKGFTSNVTCAPAPACATPGSVTVSAITGTTASISWNGAGSNYILEYGPPGFTAGTGATAGSGSSTVVPNVSSPYSLGGLSTTTPYKVVVRRICAGPTYSSNSFPVNFNTSMNCATAQVLTCGELTAVPFVSGNVGNTTYQSSTYNNAACAAPIYGDGVERLYRVTAPTNGTYQLNIATNNFTNAQQAAYLIAPVASGCGSAAFTCIGTGLSSYSSDFGNPGIPSSINTTLTAGDYYILVDASSGANGTQQFQMYCPGIPPCLNGPTYPGNNSSLANNATAIAFSWPAAFGATGYDVYINNALVSTNQAATTYSNAGTTPASFGSGATVTWRVVPRNADGTATCPTNWSFRVGGNGSINAIPLTSGVAVGGTNRTANGYSNAQTQGGYFGNDVTYSFTASPCANGVNVNFCLNAFINQNYF
ncbi:MAG TPA: fibronectin type III domain-containing protein, partial [Flavobacteriales bacterium]|nr:fibronectin type III domain-containing protein [Flavobacteriales bacterium]